MCGPPPNLQLLQVLNVWRTDWWHDQHFDNNLNTHATKNEWINEILSWSTNSFVFLVGDFWSYPFDVRRNSSVDAGFGFFSAAFSPRDDAHLHPPITGFQFQRSSRVALFKDKQMKLRCWSYQLNLLTFKIVPGMHPASPMGTRHRLANL